MPKKYTITTPLFFWDVILLITEEQRYAYTMVDAWNHSSLWYQHKNLESQNETTDHNNNGFAANMTTLLKHI